MADALTVAGPSRPHFSDRDRGHASNSQPPRSRNPQQQAQHPQSNCIRRSDPSSTNENSSTAKSDYVPVFSNLLFNLIHKYIPFAFAILFCITGIAILTYAFSLHSPLPRKLITGLASSFGLLIGFWMILGVVGYFRRRVVMGKRWNRGGHANVCGRSAARGEWLHEHDLEWGSRESQARTVVKRRSGGVKKTPDKLSTKGLIKVMSTWKTWKKWCFEKCCGGERVIKREKPVIRRVSMAAEWPQKRSFPKQSGSGEAERARNTVPVPRMSDAKKERIRALGAGKAYPPPPPSLPSVKQDHNRGINIPVHASRKGRRQHGPVSVPVIAHENQSPAHMTPALIDGSIPNVVQDIVVGNMVSDPVLKHSWENDLVPKMHAVKENRRSRSADGVRSKHDIAKEIRSPLSSDVGPEAGTVKPEKQGLMVYAEIREIPQFQGAQKLLPSVEHHRHQDAQPNLEPPHSHTDSDEKKNSRTNTLPNRRGDNILQLQKPRLKRSNTRLDVRAVPRPLNVEKSRTKRPALADNDGEMTDFESLKPLLESQNENGYPSSYDANISNLIETSPGLTTKGQIELTPISKVNSCAISQIKSQPSLLRHYVALPIKTLEQPTINKSNSFHQEDKDNQLTQTPRGLTSIDDGLVSQKRNATSSPSRCLECPQGDIQLGTGVGCTELSRPKLQQTSEQYKPMDNLESFQHDSSQPVSGHLYHPSKHEEREKRERQRRPEERENDEQEREKQEHEKRLLDEITLIIPQQYDQTVIGITGLVPDVSAPSRSSACQVCEPKSVSCSCKYGGISPSFFGEQALIHRTEEFSGQEKEQESAPSLKKSKQIRDVNPGRRHPTSSQIATYQDEPPRPASKYRRIVSSDENMIFSPPETLLNGIDPQKSGKDVMIPPSRQLSPQPTMEFDAPNLPCMIPPSDSALSLFFGPLLALRETPSHKPASDSVDPKAEEKHEGKDVEEDVTGFSDGFDGRDLNPLMSRSVSACSLLDAERSRRLSADGRAGSEYDTESLGERVVDLVNLPEVVVSNHDFGDLWSGIDHSSGSVKSSSSVLPPTRPEGQLVSGRESSGSAKGEDTCGSVCEENSDPQTGAVEEVDEEVDEEKLPIVAKQDVRSEEDNGGHSREVVTEKVVKEKSKSHSDKKEVATEPTPPLAKHTTEIVNEKRHSVKLRSKRDISGHDRDSQLAHLAELYAIDSQFIARGWRESAGSS